jgi:hypothetical protein
MLAKPIALHVYRIVMLAARCCDVCFCCVPCCCSATRAVAVLAEARAHALAGTRSAADRAAVLGSEDCQALMQQLQDRMLAIASDTGVRLWVLQRVVWAIRTCFDCVGVCMYHGRVQAVSAVNTCALLAARDEHRKGQVQTIICYPRLAVR